MQHAFKRESQLLQQFDRAFILRRGDRYDASQSEFFMRMHESRRSGFASIAQRSKPGQKCKADINLRKRCSFQDAANAEGVPFAFCSVK